MSTHTSTAPVDQAAFAGEGYVPLPGFLDQAEVLFVRKRVQAALTEPLPAGCERPHNTLVPVRWNDPLLDRVLGCERRMGDLAAAIGAQDLRWISGYISVKDARSGALWWHQDWWCWDHPVSYRRAAPQVAVLCYLAETDASNGALRVLPGSHRGSIPLHAALPEAHADQKGELHGEHVAMRDHDGQVTLHAKPGDAAVLDYRLLHGTHANASGERRDGLLLTFTPSWKDLPRDIRAHLIRHPALPLTGERPPASGWQSRLLPTFDGPPGDLTLNRIAPAEFVLEP